MKKLALLVILNILTTLATCAFADTWNVPADAPTIQAGIDLASVGDVVVIAVGTYNEVGLVMKAGITLQGAGDDHAAVIIDGQQTEQDAVRIMTFNPAGQTDPTRLENLTFADSPGGALQCQMVEDLVIERCVFSGNTTPDEGAGIYIDLSDGSVSFRDCTFLDNHATRSGGAVSLFGISHVTFERCLFVRNHAGSYGAALAVGYTGEPAIVDQCTFTGHTGGGDYTAVFMVSYAEMIITRSLVAFNAVQLGTIGSSHLGLIYWSCNDLFANQGDDYLTWEFVDGNFSADPCFCDIDGDDYHLAADSWCLPGNHPWGCDDLVGVFGEGCPAVDCGGPVPVEKESLGSLKAMYR